MSHRPTPPSRRGTAAPPVRKPARHVAAALARPPQASAQPQKSPASGTPPAPHVQAALARTVQRSVPAPSRRAEPPRAPLPVVQRLAAPGASPWHQRPGVVQRASRGKILEQVGERNLDLFNQVDALLGKWPAAFGTLGVQLSAADDEDQLWDIRMVREDKPTQGFILYNSAISERAFGGNGGNREFLHLRTESKSSVADWDGCFHVAIPVKTAGKVFSYKYSFQGSNFLAGQQSNHPDFDEETHDRLLKYAERIARDFLEALG